MAAMFDLVSRGLFERARQIIPGGVNSSVRAFRAVGGEPVFVARAQGVRIWSEGGTEYLDYVGSWGLAIFGHAYPDVVHAIQDVVTRGISFGASTALEV